MGPTALIVGKSEAVLTETVALLQSKGYAADATSRFDDVATDFDLAGYDVIVFGGQVPPATRQSLVEQVRLANRNTMLVNGLAGIPGLIVAQVEGVLAAADLDPAAATDGPAFDPDGRRITLALPDARTVRITAWWQTSFVPPDPQSTSLTLIDGQRLEGRFAIAVPAVVPERAAFATVELDDQRYSFSVAVPDVPAA